MRSSKRHLPDVACFYSWNLAATNMPWKQRASPIFFSILCFSLWNSAGRASWQHWLSSICFSPLVTFDLTSVREITCYCEIVPTIIKCVVSCSGRIRWPCRYGQDYPLKFNPIIIIGKKVIWLLVTYGLVGVQKLLIFWDFMHNHL